MPQDYEKIRQEIIKRAWKDPRFKERLLKNPKAAFKEMGWDLPDQVQVRAFEDTTTSFTLVLPPMENVHEMSDLELERLAGGQRRITINTARGCCPG